MGFKLKNILKAAVNAPVDALKDTGKKLATGDLMGALKSAALSTNPFGAQYNSAVAAVNASLTPETPIDQAVPANLVPDANVLAEQAAEDERKRRLRAPGRSQFVLNRISPAPSLISGGGTSNGLF